MNVCCMNYAIAVRIIGFLGFFGSVVLINSLRQLIAAVDEDETADKTGDMHSFLIGMLVYPCLYLISSALLVYASFVKKWGFTVPWLICEVVGIASKVIFLVTYSVKNGAAAESKIIIAVIASLMLSAYFGMSVLSALLEWKEESKNRLPTRLVGIDNCEIASSVKIPHLYV